MTAIDVRPAVSNDIKPLITFSHQCETTHTWQIESNRDLGQIDVSFRRIRLPRLVKLDYPRNPASLADSWTKRDLFLVGRMDSLRCGYLTLKIGENKAGRIVDLVVDEPFRRQGVASSLLIAAQDWLRENGIYQMTLEIQIKNEAAIALAEKLGFVFSGFMDRYFGNREIAVFYTSFFR